MNSNAPSYSWEYRAYDSEKNIVEGKAQSESFTHLAVTLRQKGFQIIEATKLSNDSSLGRDRLARMKARVDLSIEEPETTGRPPGSIRSWIAAFIRLLLKG